MYLYDYLLFSTYYFYLLCIANYVDVCFDFGLWPNKHLELELEHELLNRIARSGDGFYYTPSPF